MSSNRLYVSGGGCRREIITVSFITWTNCFIYFTIINVLELSKPVEISSMNKALAGPVNISPSINKSKIKKNQIIITNEKFLFHDELSGCAPYCM
jgi:hypothetical protein